MGIFLGRIFFVLKREKFWQRRATWLFSKKEGREMKIKKQKGGWKIEEQKKERKEPPVGELGLPYPIIRVFKQ